METNGRNRRRLLIALLSMGAIEAHAAGRKGSKRIGGTGSHGKGGHYAGGKTVTPPPKKGKR